MVRETYEQFVTDRDEDTFGGDIVAVASPATKLVLAYLILTVVVGGLVGAVLYQNPTLFGDKGYARIAGIVVLALTVIGTLRLGIKYIVLLRTKYIVTPDSVRREYQLAYREESRELPLHMIRGVELSKSRIQAFLGYATISFLAVGSNRGIGYVEFDNAADPEKLQAAVLELLENQREHATAGAATTHSESSAAATSPADDSANATETSASTTSTDEEPGQSGSGDPLVEGGENPLVDDSENDDRRPVSGNDDGGGRPADARRSED